MAEPKQPDDPAAGESGPLDLDAFAVFDPEAGEAALRKRLNVQLDEQAEEALEFPPLMGDQTLTREVSARWKALREAERQKERPDPWPIVERNFPRIAAYIREHWGKRALDDYFSKLVIDERGGRQGFPMDVLWAIMEVARLHAAQFGLAQPIRPWEADVSETKWWYKR
ncbi:MAG: hypothetical protein U1F45_14075 [Burkholderiales bacterium]